MQTLLQDIRYAVRLFVRNRGFAVVAIATLALGIGGTTAIFSLVNGVALRPLAFKDSGRLVILLPQSLRPTRFPMRSITPGDFVDWQRENRVFASMTGFAGSTFSLVEGGEPERLLGAAVTRNFFDTLAVAPLLGRTFRADDRSDTVVIGADVWRRRFNADPEVLNRRISLDGNASTVIGIMPDAFTFPRDLMLNGSASAMPTLDVWVPLDPQPGYRSNTTMQGVARLKTDVTIEQAQAELNTLSAEIYRRLGRTTTGGAGFRLVGLREDITRDVRPLLFVLLGAVGFLLLIACTNVASLLLGRAAGRRREVAIRAALGSGRWRLVRQFLTESVVLALLGGLAGLLVAAWLLDLTIRLIPSGSLPRLADVRIDPQVFAFTVAISVAAGLLFGVAPALQSSRSEIVTVLKSAGVTGTVRSRFFRVLIVAEVALAFVLLTGAGLLIRSFVRLAAVDPGFHPERALTVSVTLPERSYPSSSDMKRFQATTIDRLRRIPGVTSVGAVNWLPLGGNFLSGDYAVEGVNPLPRGLVVGKPSVSPEYFQAMEIPVLRGRAFTDRDGEGTPRVAIVSDAFARRLWPGDDAVGKQVKIWFGGPEDNAWLEVVGVAGEVKQTALSDEARPLIYIPLAQSPRPFLLRNLTFVTRTSGDPASLAGAIRQQIRSVDVSLPFDRVASLRDVVAGSVSEPRFRSLVFGTFACVALTLVGVGILGVLAHTVARRTREIGVRIALGAQRVDVVRLVVWQSLAMTGAGIVLGAAGAAVLTRLLASFLFEIRPLDPATFILASAAMLAVALVSSYLPARRATTVDPVIALRSE